MATTSGTNTCDDVSDAKALSTDARDDKGMLTIFSLGNKLLSKLEKSVEEHSDVASTLAYPTPRSMLADAAQPDTPRNCSEDAFQTPQRHQTDEKSRGCCASTYDADGFPVMSESDQEMPCDEQGEPKKHLTEPDAKHFYDCWDVMTLTVITGLLCLLDEIMLEQGIDAKTIDEATFFKLVEEIFLRCNLLGRWSDEPSWGSAEFSSDELLMLSLG